MNFSVIEAELYRVDMKGFESLFNFFTNDTKITLMSTEIVRDRGLQIIGTTCRRRVKGAQISSHIKLLLARLRCYDVTRPPC